MVTYIRSDLDFILAQIKIAEAHSAGQPLFGAGGLIPAYNVAWGLRTVDGSYNHLLPGQEMWGAAGAEFPELMDPIYRPADGTPFDPDGPGPAPAMPTAPNYNPSNNPSSLVFDSSLRTISNLLVDQTLGNPAAILTALERAGSENPLADLPAITAIYQTFKPSWDAEYQARVVMQNAKTAVDAAVLGADGDPTTPLSPEEQITLDNANAALTAATTAHAGAVTALEAARVVRDAALEPFGITMQGDNVHLPAVAPDEGLSAPFNSWFTLFGQFFDHGLDLINKGGSGTVFIPLQPDDPLYVEGSHTNFMVLTRATVSAGTDGVMGTADDVKPVNTTTSYVDQNQTYTSHASHQVFLRQYETNAAGDPVATGRLIEGGNGGMATWGEVKAQARTLLGINLTDADVGSVPLLRTDPYGNFIPGPNGFPQLILGVGTDGIPNTADDVVLEGDPTANGGLGISTTGAIRTPHAFLADIAHEAVPIGKIADGDITVGLGNPGNGDTEYDNELLDAHFIAGDGRANENIGLIAVHHVFHAEHNRLVEHTKETVLASNDLAFINEWLAVDVAAVPSTPAEIEALVWDGERLFQAAKFGTEMQYQHLVFEEFARKVQPNINVFLVPDGFDTTIDPSIVAEFAHVVYRFGHSMLTESIDRFDPAFNQNHIGLIEGFLNPLAFDGGASGVAHSITDDVAAGAIIRGMTRQVGNEIDEFVTTALRNNLLGLPLDLATINLARGRDTGVPSLNEARRTFYEATNEDVLLKPYESWVDFAGHLKHEASIINFIAAYGTHASILSATTLEAKRDAAMALIGLTSTGSEAVAISNASFETDSLATGAPGVITDPLGNYTFTGPTGWTMTGTGGLFAPAASVINPAGLQGTNVVWLGQDGLLSRDTGVVLEDGASYSLSFDIGDRTDTTWPGGVARLVASDGTVLASQVLAAPADGNWATVTFQTAAIAGALVGQTLRIEIQQTGGTSNQILVDDIQLSVLSPLAPLDEADRQAFLNGTGQYASNLGGLENVDLWIGGLAEEIMPFGGMLGSTFNFVFEVQMEKLQSGDRFYYLQRLDGLHLFGEMENNSFAAMIMRNTDATHLPSDVFSTPGLILEVDRTKQYNPGLGEDAGVDGILEDDPLTAVNESADNRGLDPVGTSLLTPLVIRDNPSTPGVDTNYLRYTGGDHVVLGGTEANDTLIAGIGDDTLFGDGGNDLLEGGFGNDIINGGDGDDIIKDSGGDDNIKAGKGNDVVHAGPGLDLVMGNDGHDFIFLGTDMGSEVFAGTGNDYIYGNKNAERILGNEGNDWIETGTFDGAPGDNFDEVFAQDGIDGHDVFLGDGGFDEFIAEGGDDIMVGSAGRGKMAGMSGFDWATYKDNTMGVDADFTRGIVFDENPTPPANGTLDAYESVEGLSGSRFNDVLTGSDVTAAERLPFAQGGSEGYRGSQLTKEGLALIAGLREVLGLTEAQVNALAANAVVYNAGEIILGGDGSDLIMGRGGDDIIDGDKWLDVNIAVMSGIGPDGGVGTILETHKSMTTLAAKMFNGTYNPGQLRIIREIKTDTTTGDIDTAKYQGARTDYTFGATADGQLIVTDVTELNLDGSDKLRNIERVQFATGNALNIIVGTPGNDAPLNGTAQDDLILGLAGADTLNGLAGDDILVGGADGVTTTTTSRNYVDNFETSGFGNSNGTTNWGPDWDESNDGGDSPNAGQIRLDDGQNALRFNSGDGAQIQRTVDLSGATTATLAYTVAQTGLDGGADGDTVTVFFSRNGTDFVQVDQITSASALTPRNLDLTTFGTGPFTANAAIRFVVNTLEAGEFVSIDNLVINSTTVTTSTTGDTLNGGTGNDIYSFALGDGSDVINEAASSGTADKISILAPVTGTDVDGLPVHTISALNVTDNNGNTNDGDLVINYSLPNGPSPLDQTIRVANHFDGANAETGVELINFNGAFFNGYQLVGDYAISRADPGGGGTRVVNLAASTANNLIAGEDADNDAITGGSGNDLIFGGGDNDDLVGGVGDDLLVGGTGNDDLDARTTGDPDNLDLVGALGADTMVGGLGNDTYGVDDLLDVVVENVGEGTDTVETFMAALSLEAMANVENLSYEGADADQFVGTGNALNNVISGGDLNDTLSGLAGNDTLIGGLGADTLIGGDGNDIYDVDDAGDIVTETNADALVGGVDRVDSDVDFTLGANLENLNLTGAAVIGRGNALANVINGNGAANQLFGAGGADTLNGDDGNDFLDGGADNDIINGGDDNDTIIGGAGNDTIDVGGGVNTIIYNAAGFGNDIINSFDPTGGTAATQDLIDLSALGVTAANFATRVTLADIEDGTTDDTLVTVRDAANAVLGTIRIEEVDVTNISATDFILAGASTVLPGATTANNTLNGTAGNDIINALAGNDTVNGGAGNDTITGGLNGTGGPGADILNGDAGDDTFIWNANTAAANSLVNSDGRDIVNGGTEGGVGDTFVINGNANAETYRIYTRAAWDAIAGNNGGSLNGATEIVVTRGPNSDFGSVIAELREIEEIRINGVDPAGATGSAGGDTFEIIGDFSTTSLRLNTITIDGQAGDDTVDISALSSAHRIVFRSNGGNDTIVGTLRPQDVIELPDGAVPEDYEVTTDENGVTTMTSPSHSICFTSEGGMPQFGSGDHEDDEDDEDDDDHGHDDDEDDDHHGGDDDDDDDDHHGHDDDDDDCGCDDEDGPGDPAPNPSTGSLRVGTAQADVLMGSSEANDMIGLAGDDVMIGGDGEDNISAGEGNDFVNAGEGFDIVQAGAGDDVVFGGSGGDVIDGEAGDDRIFGESGDDLITAGAGNDTVIAGSGNDLITGAVGDGDDTYFGDDSDGGNGTDTLDLSAITANLTVDLGNGLLGRGSASSSQSGTDTLWSIENVATGSGSDTITASKAVNVMEGGAGDDTFRFLSAEGADGDTILDFEPGDRLDLSGIDADSSQAGNQSFTLVNGPITGVGQVAVTYEMRVDGEYTIISGSTDANTDDEFRIDLKGSHSLGGGNFNL